MCWWPTGERRAGSSSTRVSPVVVRWSEGGLRVDGVPAHYGVAEQGEAFALEVLVAAVSAADLALVGEEKLTAEGVE
jgi:hypothetical protein